MYKHQKLMVPIVFKSLSESVMAALVIIMPEPPTRVVVVLDDYGSVMASRPISERRDHCS